MTLADLLKECLDVENKDTWKNERTPTPVRCFGVRLHSMGLSVRELEVVLDWVGVDRCHQAIWYWKETAADHDVADTEFLVDAGGYLTALARHELSGHLASHDRNHIEKWFQTVTMRIDRFHSCWRGSQSPARRWLRRFRHYYNRHRPNQALDGSTPAEEVLN